MDHGDKITIPGKDLFEYLDIKWTTPYTPKGGRAIMITEGVKECVEEGPYGCNPCYEPE